MAPRPHILTVNDDPALLALYRELLEEEGYRVTVVAHPPPSPAEVADLAPDLVLVDLDPWVGGADVRRWLFGQLKVAPATAHLPVVACTETGPAAAEWADLAAVVCALVPKPFDLDALLSAIARCLGTAAA